MKVVLDFVSNGCRCIICIVDVELIKKIKINGVIVFRGEKYYNFNIIIGGLIKSLDFVLGKLEVFYI